MLNLEILPDIFNLDIYDTTQNLHNIVCKYFAKYQPDEIKTDILEKKILLVYRINFKKLIFTVDNNQNVTLVVVVFNKLLINQRYSLKDGLLEIDNKIKQIASGNFN